MKGTMQRIGALIIKELHQISRDMGNLAIAVAMPIILLILFGYGVSMDINNISVAYNVNQITPFSQALSNRLALSSYITIHQVQSTQEAEQMLTDHRVKAIISLQQDAVKYAQTEKIPIQIIVNGVNPNEATLIQNYLSAIVSNATLGNKTLTPPIQVETRMRFNEANSSKYYLIPGVIVITMTMIGALLTALVMAREYERGTIEGLFATPVRSAEILISKAVTNFFLGIVSLSISLLFAVFIFQIPMQGSLWIIILVSSIYLMVTLGLGLVISSTTKNQFLACQFAILGTFMPALMLSGFIYDTLNMPFIVRMITYLVPAKYYNTLLQTLFLAGDVPSIIWQCSGILCLFALVLMLIAHAKTPKSLD